MTWWIGLLAIVVAVAQVGVVAWVGRRMAEIRGHVDRWRALAGTQAKHEVDLRYLRELVNPMARSGHAPMPEHLRQENYL